MSAPFPVPRAAPVPRVPGPRGVFPRGDSAPESPAVGLPVVGVAPETNRLDLAAMALAQARGERNPLASGGFAAPASPALGMPALRSAPPGAHGPGAGPLRRLLGTRRAVAGLAVVGAVAGAGVAALGVSSALAGPETPAPQDSTQQGSTQQGAATPWHGGGSGASGGGGAAGDSGY